MGQRGPSKKPYEIKELEGFPGGRNKAAPPAVVPKKQIKIPIAPRCLCKRGKSVWKQLCKQLVELNLLTGLDHFILTRYCDMYVKWQDAQEELNLGMVQEVTTKEGGAYYQTSPYFSIYKNLNTSLRQIEREFGLTLAARSSITIAPKSAAGDETGEFLFQGNQNATV